MSELSLVPCYTPSLPAPSYSCEPTCNEQTLEHTPRPGSRPTPTGTYTKISKRVTLVLNEQEDNAQVPSYGRHSLVSGTIHLENCETVGEVVLKVRFHPPIINPPFEPLFLHSARRSTRPDHFRRWFNIGENCS